MKAEPKAADAAAPNSKKKMMIIAIVGAVLLIGGGGGAAMYMSKSGADDAHPAKEKAHKKSAKSEKPEYLPVDAFTVNLQPENGDQYLQVQFTLQVSNLEEAELVKANMAKVRSRVLLLLSGKKASEISSVEGKQKLATEILASVKEPFVEKGDEQEVSEVLFTSFIIQ